MTTEILSRGEWLAVSTEGFAEQQRGRPLAHLVKELVQNALDAVDEDGEINLDVTPLPGLRVLIECSDDGPGAEDLHDLNVVFLTSKKDSTLKRGRMGRGFKELLSIADEAIVHSRGQTLHFARDDSGKPIVTLTHNAKEADAVGFDAALTVTHDEARQDLFPYFSTFLFPRNVGFRFNGQLVPAREWAFLIPARLTTERFSNGRWEKPVLSTAIELYPCGPDETPTIYEMGIPVCPVDWTVRFHCNVLQRVPMNPNRDAVAAGYADKVRRACLPTLLPHLDADQTRESWVGDAAAKLNDPALQRKVVEQAFGQNVARSTPSFGRFDHDQNAREEAGATILNTSQLTGGFKHIVQQVVPSSKTLAAEVREAKETVLAPVPPYSIVQIAQINHKAPQNEIEGAIVRIGRTDVMDTLMFCERIGQKILDALEPHDPPTLTVRASIMQSAEATYSVDHVMTFNLGVRKLWTRPADSYFLEVMIHELAHARAMHHGDSFTRALERVAGHAALILYNDGRSAGGRSFP
jgi:hypothetical protein